MQRPLWDLNSGSNDFSKSERGAQRLFSNLEKWGQRLIWDLKSWSKDFFIIRKVCAKLLLGFEKGWKKDFFES